MRKAYKHRLYPTKEQAETLTNSLDLLRELYNAAVQERRDAWKLNRHSVSFADQSRQIPAIRESRPEFFGVQARVMMQTLRQVDKAFRAFYRRCKTGERPGFPRFKSEAFFQSFFYNREGFKLLGKTLRLANIGNVKIRLHRPVEGIIKEVAVKREGSKWFAILSCDEVPAHPLPISTNAVGIDVGVESFATLSNGSQIPNWKYYESAARQLRIAQRRVARRRKGSNRRRKAVVTLRAIHTKIANRRRDFQHKLSTELINQYGLIAVEALNIKGLARMGLAKQVLDASWSSFIEMLSYKAESAGRLLVKVDPRGTSQRCSSCGDTVKKDLSVRQHHCPNCGLSLHRDHNAALNILSAGLADQDVKWAVAPCLS